VFDSNPRSQYGANMSRFLIMVWASDPNFVPIEVGFSILELVEPFMEGAPLPFLRASKIIYSKCDLLHYKAIISILEVHDFNPPPPATLMMVVAIVRVVLRR
jgi:hypothetical protein